MTVFVFFATSAWAGSIPADYRPPSLPRAWFKTEVIILEIPFAFSVSIVLGNFEPHAPQNRASNGFSLKPQMLHALLMTIWYKC